MTTSIDEAIAAAAAAAATTPAATPAAAPAPTTAVATPAPTGVAPAVAAAPLTMDSMMTGAIAVDKWLKVKAEGLKIGDDPSLIESMVVDLEMVERVGFVPKQVIKFGDPAQYLSTQDGVNCLSGGTWEAAVTRAQQVEQSRGKAARPYRSVDLGFTIAEPVKNMKSEEVEKAGVRLGYATSTTNWANWEGFYRAVVAAGLLGRVVRVKLGSQAKTNANKQVWGVVTFELLGEAGDGE